MTLEEKAAIVAESFDLNTSVSQVARNHGLTPTQLFTWRREARRDSATIDGLAFVPAIVERLDESPPRPVIELDIGGDSMWIRRDADEGLVTAVIRKGVDGLAALVRETMAADPFDGAIYVFPRQANGSHKARVLGRYWRLPGYQATGGRRIPLAEVADGAMRLSAAQLSALFEGLDWRRVQAKETAAPMLPG